MAKFSQKMEGKEVGAAEVYAEPHKMTGEKLDMKTLGGGAFDYSDMKTSGIEVRGCKNQTKGKMSRGPMA